MFSFHCGFRPTTDDGWAMFSKVGIAWFASIYGVTLALEVSRLFFRAPVRLAGILLLGVLGLCAHTTYLIVQARNDAATAPLSSWSQWCLVGAWLLMAIYLFMAASRPQTALGVFLLPLVLGLVALSTRADKTPFAREQAMAIWGTAHGIALLLGMVVAALGFVAGVMYLIQSYQLKKKLPPQTGLKLPSLEWLQNANKQALIGSSFLVAIGLVAGVVMNAIRQARDTQAVPWNDPVIVTSCGLLAWLVAAVTFEFLYKPAQQGRKVAYLTIASFAFVVVALVFVVNSNSQHAAPKVSFFWYKPAAEAGASI
jgi:ABC-type uncharacterized transport system permease subunit